MSCVHDYLGAWVKLPFGLAYDGVVVLREKKIQRFADKTLLGYAFPLPVPGAEAKFLESRPVFWSEIMGFSRFIGSGRRDIGNIA